MNFGDRNRTLLDRNTRLTRVGGENDPAARMTTAIRRGLRRRHCVFDRPQLPSPLEAATSREHGYFESGTNITKTSERSIETCRS